MVKIQQLSPNRKHLLSAMAPRGLLMHLHRWLYWKLERPPPLPFRHCCWIRTFLPGSEYSWRCSSCRRSPASTSVPSLYFVVLTLIVESNPSQVTGKRVLPKQKPDEVEHCDFFSVINLQLSSNFSLYFLPPVVFLCLSGLHPLQNSHCPGQRGDRLLLLEDDCPQREQRWEWIPTSDPLLTLTFIFKCQPCLPPNPTFCFWVFIFPPPKWENVLLSFQIPSVTIYSRLHHLGCVQPHSQLDASTYSPTDFTQICLAAACRRQNCVSKTFNWCRAAIATSRELRGEAGDHQMVRMFETAQHLVPK